MSVFAPERVRPKRALEPPKRRWPVPLLVLSVLLLGPVLMRWLVAAIRQLPDAGGLLLSRPASWGVVSVVAVLALALLAYGMFGQTSQHYRDTGERDLRLDVIRGLAIVLVVLNQIDIPSLFQIYSQEAVGPVSGAELFVALSGLALGVACRSRLARSDLPAVTAVLLKRAFRLYCTALVIVVTVFLLTRIPGVDGSVVSTFTDPRSGQRYEVYPNMERLLDYPVPGFVLRDILFLRLGPFQLNILGLYVLLLVAAPLMVAALRARLVLILLAVSWTVYLLNRVHPTELLGSQFEDPFPLFTWQVLFVHAMAAGWYRETLLRWARTWAGKATLALLVLGQVAMLAFSWSNPFLSNAYDVRLSLLADTRFTDVYGRWFERADLELGRLLATGLAVLTLYAALTTFWKPLNDAVGWFLIPMGQATLYVFVLHVLFVLMVANVPLFNRGYVVLDTLAHGAVLGVLWLMVKRRFLFKVIAR